MNKYIVKLKGVVINGTITIIAEDFTINSIFGEIIFKDNEGNNVAYYKKDNVESIKLVENDAVLINYPIGISQVREIIKLSGLLQNEGVNVKFILQELCEMHSIKYKLEEVGQ